jgi:TetR/AcrR family fatty acid metabolism transcriptional regulator
MSESSLTQRRPKRAASKATANGRRSGDKRERILRAAVKVFAKNGFHATRVSEVAKAAGVADGTIYLYFKSKDELLVSLFEDRVERLLAFMRE